MEIDKVDGKFKRKSTREEKRQLKYEGFEKFCKSDAVEKLRQKPYALIYAERVKKHEATKKADQREQDTDEQAQSRDRKLDGAVRE